MPKGQENVDKMIDICRDMISTIGSVSFDGNISVKTATEQITAIMEGLEEISGKFFLKSNPSIPPTNACLKSAGAFAEILKTYEEGQDSTIVQNGLADFIRAFESLAQKASMRSTVIT
jgi:hypothetical protein